jgi:hypothetical protein
MPDGRDVCLALRILMLMTAVPHANQQFPSPLMSTSSDYWSEPTQLLRALTESYYEKEI